MGRYAVNDMSNVKIDEELRNLLPPLKPEEFEKLEESILKNGVLDPVKVWLNDKTGEIYLIDGHNRYSICTKHNISMAYWNIQYFDSNNFKTKKDVIKWILENQLGRRNLSIPERYEILQRYKSMFEEKAKANMSAGGKGSTILPKVDTRKEMAKIVGTSEGTYSKLDKIFNSNNEEVKNKVKTGKISVSKAIEKINPIQEKYVGKEINTKNKELEKNLNGLSAVSNNLQSTEDCDELISQLEKHSKQLLAIKKDTYSRRNKIYKEMPIDSELTCKIEEEIINKYKHFIFHIVKSSEKFSNNKPVLDIMGIILIDTNPKEKYLEQYLDRSKSSNRLNNKEFNLLSMTAYAKQKEEIQKDKEEKIKLEEESKKHWDKIGNDFNNIFLGAITTPIDPEVKDMMGLIIKQGFKELAKKHHPDVSGDDGHMMIVVGQAKELLGKII